MKGNNWAEKYSFFPLTPSYVKENYVSFQQTTSGIPHEAWTVENYLYELPRKWDFSLALKENNTQKLVGFIIASQKERTIHIHKYAVHPSYRSAGLGAYMLRFFEKAVKKAKHEVVSLYVDKANPGAVRFYERNGFTFDKAGEDSLVFYTKRLPVLVAIHQPNLFPWLGFFHKIASCDKFIILDHVTNRPNDAIYTKRVTVVCNGQEYWLTVPLLKPKNIEFVPINQMKINDADRFADKHLKTIVTNYSKAPFFNDVFPFVEKFYRNPSALIATRNIEFITEIKNKLGFEAETFLSSDYDVRTHSSELLIDLIKKVGGNTYLHGKFAVSEKGYQDNLLFAENGIDLVEQQFSHPVYKQFNNRNDFVKGTSIIDALMNIGFDAVRETLIKNDAQSISPAL